MLDKIHSRRAIHKSTWPVTAIVRSPRREFKNGVLSANAILSFSLVCQVRQDPKPNDAWLASYSYLYHRLVEAFR